MVNIELGISRIDYGKILEANSELGINVSTDGIMEQILLPREVEDEETNKKQASNGRRCAPADLVGVGNSSAAGRQRGGHLFHPGRAGQAISVSRPGLLRRLCFDYAL